MRRRRGRDRFSVEEDRGGYGSTSANTSSSTSSSRGPNSRYFDDEDDNDDVYAEVEFDEEDDGDGDGYFDEFDDNDDDDDDDEFDNGDIIPNALLDQIDPDGAIERMPELLSDPQFYRDAAIVAVLFLLYAFNRFDNPLYDIKDIDKIDFSTFY